MVILTFFFRIMFSQYYVVHHEMAMVSWFFRFHTELYFSFSGSSNLFLVLFFTVQFDEFPTKLIFFCEIAPPEGGQTAIVLSHKITQRMEQIYPLLIKKLEKEGLIYPSSLNQEDDPQSVLRGWQSRYETNNKQEAEKR